MTKLKISNWDKTQTLKWWQNLNKDKSQFMRRKKKKSNGFFSKNIWHLDNRWDVLWAAFCDSCNVFDCTCVKIWFCLLIEFFWGEGNYLMLNFHNLMHFFCSILSRPLIISCKSKKKTNIRHTIIHRLRTLTIQLIFFFSITQPWNIQFIS